MKHFSRYLGHKTTAFCYSLWATLSRFGPIDFSGKFHGKILKILIFFLIKQFLFTISVFIAIDP
jgi:hypothetical protein